MGLIAWIISSLLISYSLSQEVSDVYSSANAPAYYDGDEATFTCTYALDDITSLVGFGLKKPDVDNSPVEVGCAIARSPGGVSVNVQGSGVTAEDCTKAWEELSATQTTTLKIKATISQTGAYQCLSWTTTAYARVEPVVDIATLLTAPTSLMMTLDGTSEVNGEFVIYDKSMLTVTCKSEGGDPAADLEFGRDGEVVGPEIAAFEVSSTSDGASFFCRDKSHPHLKPTDSSLTYQNASIVVYYFNPTGLPATQSLRYNPTETRELSCSTQSKLKPDASIVYTWTKDGVAMEESMSFIEVTGEPTANETYVEMYACEATVAGDDALFEPIIVNYNITWDVATTTPTTTTTTTTPKPTTTNTISEKPDKTPEKEKSTEEKDPTMIIIIVVVVVTVLILIVVIVIIVIKRRNSDNSAAEVSKQASAPQKNKDAEQGNGDADATEPMLTQESEGGDKTVTDGSGK